MKISIVLPIHNEYENLRILLKEWDNGLNKIKNFPYEFVLVEDGSTDGTKDLIKELEKEYPILNLSTEKKRGYTKAVIDGINFSNGEYILCTDSDNQIKVESLIENIDNLPIKNSFLFGFRNPRKDPINRIIYSKLFKIFHDILFNSKLKDPSCPFVIGKNSDFKKLPIKQLNQMREGFWWGFVGTAIKMKMNFKEVPIIHYKREKGEAGYKIPNLPSIILRNLIGLIKIRFAKV